MLNKKTKLKERNNKPILVFAILIVPAFFFWQNSKAIGQTTDASISQEITNSADQTQEKIKELQKKAEVYRQIIEIKQKQSASLNDQLSIADSNIEQVQSEINLSKVKIDNYNSQITRLQNQVAEKDSIMLSQKKILIDLMQAYYEANLKSPVISYLTDDNVASFMVTKDRLSQTGDKIKDLLIYVKNLKVELENQALEIDQKKSAIVEARNNLEDKSVDLESIKQKKETLLAQTKGEEAKYAALLKRVEQQKQELLDIDEYYASSGLTADTYPKPDSKYYAPTSWYFSQRDPSWGNKTIGNTKTLMKSYGCAVTAVAMVFKQHGSDVTPGTMANQSIFSGDLINWPNSWKSPAITLASSGKSHGNVNWSTIDTQIKNDHPVIVFIKRSIGGSGHYVVIHHKTSDGKYVVHDPYFGSNIYLETTRALVGAMGTKSSTSIDQMIIYN